MRLVVTVVVSVLLCSACAEDTLARVRREGAIRIGFAIEAPYAHLTADGRVTGAAPELAELVAPRVGISRVRWRLTHFGDLLDELDAGVLDAVASGLFITPERQRRARFSQPTFEVRESLLVAEGNPLGLSGYPQLARHPTARVAVLRGSAEIPALLELGLPAARLVEVPDALAARAAVATGEADALALSEPTLRWGEPTPHTTRVEHVEQPPGGPAHCGVAFRTSDESLERAWSAALVELQRTPEYAALLARYGMASGAGR
ncbi:MAG: transporter substrate-binding domain-containing protein [Myxococcota bacterium]